MKYAFRLALLAGLSGGIQAASPDEKPPNHSMIAVTVPSYRILQAPVEKCWDEMLGFKKLCLTTRVIEILETSYETDPMAWSSDTSSVTQVTVLKPAYIPLAYLFKPYVENTVCQTTLFGGKCVSTRAALEGVKVNSPSLE